jgi:hypothetical protein
VGKVKLFNSFCFFLILAAGVYSLPPPSEYTMEMFKQDLGYAHLVALVEVVAIDTIVRTERYVKFKVVKCFKGGVSSADSFLVSKRNLGMIGGYGEHYYKGLKSIICFSDTWKDGTNLMVNPRGKYDIKGDSIVPPPVGYGFSQEFTYYQTQQPFEHLIIQTIQHEEFLQFMPILPGTKDKIRFRTSIDLSGGGELNSIVVQRNDSLKRIDLVLTYTPCEGICPAIFIMVDTTVSVGQLAAGTYSAYRFKINTLINKVQEPGSFFRADDSVRFTVYGPTEVKPVPVVYNGNAGIKCWPNPFSTSVDISLVRGASSVVRSGKADIKIYDIRGQLISTLPRTTNYELRTSYKWQAQGQPAGIYFIRIQQGHKTLSKKIYKIN